MRARGRGVGLGKRLEHGVEALGVDPDARVADGERQRRDVAGDPLHADLDGTRLGKLDGVGEQVGEHLLDAQRVTHDGARDGGVDGA